MKKRTMKPGTWRKALWLGALTVFANPGLADSERHYGRISTIAPTTGEIAINGVPYRLLWSTKIVRPDGKVMEPEGLMAGHYVFFELGAPQAPGAPPTVTELRVIPQ